MAYNTKAIKTDKDGNPISQYYNPNTDEYEPVEGAGGGNKVILYNEDGTPNNSLSLGEILDKLDQLKGTVIDEQTRQQNEQTRQQNEQQRIDLYNTLKDLDVSQYELRIQKLEHDTSVEETVVEEAYGPVIPLPENVVNGQISEIKIFGNTEAEEDNVKSTVGAIRIKSVGKNLFDNLKLEVGGMMHTTGEPSPDTTRSRLKDFLNIRPDTRYILSAKNRVISSDTTRIYFYNRDKAYIGNSTSNPFTTPIDARYFKFLNQSTNDINIKYQLEEGTIATEYEPYKESVAYITAKDELGNILELRSLPNGTKDEIDVANRKLIKRIGEKANVSSGTVINYTDMAEGGTYFAWNENGETETGNKGDTLGIDATVLIYQLAEPIGIPIEVFGSLQSYEKGTVYVDAIVPRVDFYTSEGIVLAENDVPIKEIDSLYLVNKENGLLTPLDISKAFIFPDGKGFTHPDLYNDALVDWDYVPDVEWTNPTILMKLPTNLKASVTSALQGVQELSNKTKKLDTRVIANHRDIYNLQGDFVALQSNVFGISNELDTHKADSVTDDAHGWNSALRFKAGMFSRNTTLASGTQVIDGLGFKPKAIIALALVNQGVGRMSIGVYDGNRSMGLLDGYNNTANAYINHGALIAIRQGAYSDTQYQASVASVNDDGFILNWQKGSDVTDGENIIVYYLAFR